jgi:bifunctional non-homologous end joining protein LigD
LAAHKGKEEETMNKHDLKPMLATLIDAPFDDKAWVFETKWDGFRLVAQIGRGNVTLYSRNGIDVTRKYSVIVPTLVKIKHSCVLDGELVALDKHGRSRFELLQNALNKKAKLRYCAFDLLFLDDEDLRKKPLLERKKVLRKLLPKSPYMHYSVHVSQYGKREFAKAKRKREEGIMAKRAAALYYSGKRTREWLKIKTGHEQEAVIVGFTQPRKTRKHFGSLVLAVYEKGKLSSVGHSGGGFTQKMLNDLHATMLKLETDKSPFAQKIRWEAETTWIKPTLVCEVRFTEWTRNGEMRHPVFLGLRTDKPAKQVKREIPL